jgi:hypothetical protein
MAKTVKADEDGNLMPLQQENTHKVPARQWRKWPDICQRVFNETYAVMINNQDLFLHPKGQMAPEQQWKTTAWNAAWIAAEACKNALKDIEAAVGYKKAP